MSAIIGTPKRRHRLSRRDASPQEVRISQGLNPMSKQLLVGLCGPAGCGKDTVARLMAKHGNFIPYTLALPLKRGLQAMLDIPLSTWNDREAKEKEIDWLGKSPRQLAQTLGTEWGRQCVHPDLWVMLMLRRWNAVRHSGSPRMVVTDVRFDNEAQAIFDAGGTVWRIERDNLPPVAPHKSEAGFSSRYVTGSVKNHGTLDQLDALVQHWIGFLVRRYGR